MAANRIKGIVVEIGGDTTNLMDSLKSVNSEIRNTQSQLRDVEKLLKLDPGNTELLTQRHRLLGESVEATKEKLSSLKEASKAANEALEKGTISQTQYDALQREIFETEEKLKSLEKQAGESAVAIQKIAAAGGKMQELGSKVETVGQKLLPVSAGMTAIGVAGLKVASDFEKSMSGVQAITGATGDEFEALRQKAIELGASTSFSSGDVAEAMTEMAKAGWSTTQIIDGMGGVLNVAAASGESLGSVATIVADAITGFGLSAKDSVRVADLMTQAANSGTIGVTDLGESYKYVAPMAQSMGLSIEDVATALSAMSMAGIKGSQAGTSLGTILANMTKPSKAVAAAMDDLGISITNSDGSFKSLNEIMAIMRTSFAGLTDDQKAFYATALAGKEGMSGPMLNLTQEEYDTLSASMNNCSGVAGQTAAVMQDNLQSKVEQLGGALESLAIKLSEYVIPFLIALVERITALVEWFTNLNPWIQKAILLIGGVIAVAGPLLILVGKIITSVGTIMMLLPKLSGLITTAKTAFTWGAGIINGIVNGIRSCISKIKSAVTDVAETIWSFLHFSVPDEGPLTDYESWMPDFMSGLARGIEKSRGMVAKAVESVAGDMVISPKMNVQETTFGENSTAVKSTDFNELVNVIRDTMAGTKSREGNIVIPVYIGGTLLDEVVVSAQTRQNLRSGGR